MMTYVQSGMWYSRMIKLRSKGGAPKAYKSWWCGHNCSANRLCCQEQLTHDVNNKRATTKTVSNNLGGQLALNLVMHSQNKDINIVWLR